MVRQVRMASAASTEAALVPGSVRECARYRGELARHRVITADGLDYVVATADERRQGRGFVTGAYPMVRGYLVMMRQPLYVLGSGDESAAREQHELLVATLARAGTGVVRARRRSAAWRRAEEVVQPSGMESRSEDVGGAGDGQPTLAVVGAPTIRAKDGGRGRAGTPAGRITGA